MNAAVVSRNGSKALGQTFTGEKTARLLAALAWRRGIRSVVDPMAGTGDLLAAWARIGPGAELFGVEIEPKAAKRGAQRLGSAIRKGDAFTPETWRQAAARGLFDLVIANPPYVRYQALATGTRNPGHIRSSLLRIASELAPAAEAAIWEKLIRAYSGFADLSVPSWLLCGLLAKPGGTLALVAPQMWLNRDYARVVRYAFQRFFQPLVIVQESGQRWFPDVLVPVSLIVGRRRPAEESVIPLHERRSRESCVTSVEVSKEAASGLSHVGAAFPGQKPELQFARWLDTGGGRKKSGIRVSRHSWSDREILSACRRDKWLDLLEPAGTAAVSAQELPSGLARLLPAGLARHMLALSDTPLRVGQGLRTGCNPFFYVDCDEYLTRGGECTVRLSDLFDARAIPVPAEVLVPVLRRQAEAVESSISAASLRGRALNLRGWYLPEDPAARGGRAMPASLADHVRTAALTRYSRGGGDKLIPDLSAVSPNAAGAANGERSNSGALPGRWYMLPEFTPRHRPALFLPRIIHDEPRVGMNSTPPALVDANFSTFWSDDEHWHPHAAFALLNSTWARFCMEALGTPLGGGALKLEATHLRRLPLPPLSQEDLAQLRRLASAANPAAIDQLIFSRLGGKAFSARETANVAARLGSLIAQLRAKRRLSPLNEHP